MEDKSLFFVAGTFALGIVWVLSFIAFGPVHLPGDSWRVIGAKLIGIAHVISLVVVAYEYASGKRRD